MVESFIQWDYHNLFDLINRKFSSMENGNIKCSHWNFIPKLNFVNIKITIICCKLIANLIRVRLIFKSFCFCYKNKFWTISFYWNFEPFCSDGLDWYCDLAVTAAKISMSFYFHWLNFCFFGYCGSIWIHISHSLSENCGWNLSRLNVKQWTDWKRWNQ